MAIRQITNPPVEPVTLAEVKLHSRIDVNDDDSLLNGLIATAREYCETFTGRAFVERQIMLTLNHWPRRRVIVLPRPPVISVDSVQYYTVEGTPVTLVEGDDYLVDTVSEPGAIILPNGVNWPSASLYALNPIRITFTAGYTPIPGPPIDHTSNIPAYLKSAIKLCVGAWYENRENVLPAGNIGKELPMGASALLWKERVFWSEDVNR